MALLRPHRPRAEGARVPGPALGRPAAARRDRPRAGDEPEADAARRDHERARPAARLRGADARARALRARRHDDDPRHARDELRARGLAARSASSTTARSSRRARPSRSSRSRARSARGSSSRASSRRGGSDAPLGTPRCAIRKGPLAIAGILAAPLFFCSLMGAVARDRPPADLLVAARGHAISRLPQPPAPSEARIWLWSLLPLAIMLAIGLLACLWRLRRVRRRARPASCWRSASPTRAGRGSATTPRAGRAGSTTSPTSGRATPSRAAPGSTTRRSRRTASRTGRSASRSRSRSSTRSCSTVACARARGSRSSTPRAQPRPHPSSDRSHRADRRPLRAGARLDRVRPLAGAERPARPHRLRHQRVRRRPRREERRGPRRDASRGRRSSTSSSPARP